MNWAPARETELGAFLEDKATAERKAWFAKWAKDALLSAPVKVFNYTKIRSWVRTEAPEVTAGRSQAQDVADSQMVGWQRIWREHKFSEDQVELEQDDEYAVDHLV